MIQGIARGVAPSTLVAPATAETLSLATAVTTEGPTIGQDIVLSRR